MNSEVKASKSSAWLALLLIPLVFEAGPNGAGFMAVNPFPVVISKAENNLDIAVSTKLMQTVNQTY